MPPTSSTWPRHVDNYPRYMDTLASVCAYRHRSMYACVMYMSYFQVTVNKIGSIVLPVKLYLTRANYLEDEHFS